MLYVTLFRSGNTLRMTVPKAIAQSLNLNRGTRVLMTVDGTNRVTMRNADQLITQVIKGKAAE